MTDTTSPALRTWLAYYQAWTSHDLDKAMSYIADDIVCDTPAGRLEGAEAYRGFQLRHGRIGTGELIPREAAEEMRRQQIRIQRDGLAESRDGTLPLVIEVQRHTQIALDFRASRQLLYQEFIFMRSG